MDTLQLNMDNPKDFTDLGQDIISRLDTIEALLKDTAKKDAMIGALHADLRQQHTDFLSDLREPVMQSLLKVATRMIEIDRRAKEVVVLDNPAFENLASQVQNAAELITDILSDNFDVEIISPPAGEQYERDKHLSIEAVATESADKDRTIAEVVEPGYLSLTSGKILRQARVKTYKYQ